DRVRRLPAGTRGRRPQAPVQAAPGRPPTARTRAGRKPPGARGPARPPAARTPAKPSARLAARPLPRRALRPFSVLDRHPAHEAGVLAVPVRHLLFVHPPTQTHLHAVFPRRKIYEADVRIL